MRWILGTLLVAMLAGCAGTPTQDTVEDCTDCDPCAPHDHSEAADGNGTLDNATHDHACLETEAVVNITAPPLPVLTLTNAAGEVLNGTAVLAGETITFSAKGTTAEAGVVAAALTVVEPNGTTTVSLFEGDFVDATLTFPRAGVVNATLRVMDGAGIASSAARLGFVDHAQSGSQGGKAYVPGSKGCTATVNADSQAPLIGNQFYHAATFQVGADVKWLSVQGTSVGAVAICDPDGKRIDTGDSGGYAQTDVGDWPRSTQYFVALHPSGPNVTMGWTVTVHYGEQPEA